MKKSFVNELGNLITIEITELPEDYINISIEGPKSISTNCITKMEAIYLRDMLENWMFK